MIIQKLKLNNLLKYKNTVVLNIINIMLFTQIYRKYSTFKNKINLFLVWLINNINKETRNKYGLINKLSLIIFIFPSKKARKFLDYF